MNKNASIKKELANIRKALNAPTRWIMLYTETPEGKKIKFSQAKKEWHKLFSYSLLTDKIEEVETKMWVDEKKVIHSIAIHDENKIYIQAINAFQANTLFKKFNDRHLKLMEYEKETQK